MPPVARRYRPADRADVLAYIGDPRPLAAGSHRVHVCEDAGRVAGVSITLFQEAGDVDLAVMLAGNPPRLDVIHALLLALVEDCVAEGREYGYSRVRLRSLVRALQRRYGVAAEPSGWHPVSGRPEEWTLRVHLPSLLAQLRGMP